VKTIAKMVILRVWRYYEELFAIDYKEILKGVLAMRNLLLLAGIAATTYIGAEALSIGIEPLSICWAFPMFCQ